MKPASRFYPDVGKRGSRGVVPKQKPGRVWGPGEALFPAGPAAFPTMELLPMGRLRELPFVPNAPLADADRRLGLVVMGGLCWAPVTRAASISLC